MLPRVLSLDERVRTSELFPRIRDAEKGMLENELAFQKKRERHRKRLERQKKKDLKKDAEEADEQTLPSEPSTHYFTGFVLNKDPSASKYMPFDEIFFPKLFNKTTAEAPPDAINSLWMLGFEDHCQRNAVPNTAIQHTEMVSSTLADPTKKSDTEAISKKKKNNHHRFVGVYRNKVVVSL
mmetsp:Transcript_17379/g.29368  ORF Transcript_17379/g.29368 Transcript_17379/m.29368 type:complete len:181 (+) Transcript_17379:119-661(+)